MDIATYSAASAGMLQMRKLEVQNNNLANVNTIGFKRQYVVAERSDFEDSFAKALEAKDPYARADQSRVSNVSEGETRIDFSQGPIKNTGNPFDVALKNPNDFFVINTPEGVRYSRAGNFTLNAAGELVTQDGYQVQGDGGALIVQAAGASIAADGSVVAGVQNFGRVQTVRFTDTTKLLQTGGARFKLQGGAAPQQIPADLEPKSVEMSNVSAVTGMIDLITTNRAFDAYTKAAQTIDNLNQAAINQVGKRQ
jgi:flagellar basal-body rod protein FlgF